MATQKRKSRAEVLEQDDPPLRRPTRIRDLPGDDEHALTVPEGGQRSSVPKKGKQAQFPSRQAGYTQPSREGKAIVKAYIQKQARPKLRNIAKQANLTLEELLEYLAITALHKAETDSLFRSELAAEGERVTETKRLAKEAAQQAAAQAKRSITERRNASRPFSQRLGGKPRKLG